MDSKRSRSTCYFSKVHSPAQEGPVQPQLRVQNTCLKVLNFSNSFLVVKIRMDGCEGSRPAMTPGCPVWWAVWCPSSRSDITLSILRCKETQAA